MGVNSIFSCYVRLLVWYLQHVAFDTYGSHLLDFCGSRKSDLSHQIGFLNCKPKQNEINCLLSLTKITVWSGAVCETFCVFLLQVFTEVAYKARNSEDILTGMDEYIDGLTVLPPSVWDPAVRLEPPTKTMTEVRTLPIEEWEDGFFRVKWWVIKDTQTN